MKPHPKVIKHRGAPPPAPGKAARVFEKCANTDRSGQALPVGGGQPSLWRWGQHHGPQRERAEGHVRGHRGVRGGEPPNPPPPPPPPPTPPPPTSPHARCPALAGADPPGQVFVFLQIAAPALVAWFGLEGTSFSAMNLAQASMSVWA